jgi:hypothetical protein
MDLTRACSADSGMDQRRVGRKKGTDHCVLDQSHPSPKQEIRPQTMLDDGPC